MTLSLQEQAQNLAQSRLHMNNGTHQIANSFLTIFAGGNGSAYMRDYIDHRLASYIGDKTELDWDKLQKCTSLQQKIAYVVGVDYEHHHKDTNNVVEAILVDQRLQEVITFLQDQLFAQHDFSESFIVRHAALHNMPLSLSHEEKNKLIQGCKSLMQVAHDNNLDDVVKNVHGFGGSDAQKIMKAYETIGLLQEKGHEVPVEVIQHIDQLKEKLKPLHELDDAYKRVGSMHTAIHTIGRNVAQKIVYDKQKNKLFGILQDMGHKPDDFLYSTANTKSVIDQLSELLHFNNRQKLEQSLQKNGVSRKDFEQWFLSYYSLQNLDTARLELHQKKNEIFGNNIKRYEQDVNRWRSGAKKRLLDAADRVGPHGKFVDPLDATMVGNYLDTCKSVFAADADTHPDEHQRMKQVLSAVIRERIPSVSHTFRLSGWIEKMKYKLNNRFPTLFDNINDDADVFATLIIAQATTAQDIYYDDSNINISPETTKQKIAKGLAKTEYLRQGVKGYLKNPLKKITHGVTWAVRNAGSLAFQGVAGLGKGTAWTAGKFNKWTVGKFSWLKTPAYVAYPFTRILEAVGTGVNQGMISLLIAGKWSRQALIKELQKASGDQQTQNLSDAVRKLTDASSQFLGKRMSKRGNNMYNKVDVKQQNEFLKSFYELASTDVNINHTLQATGLASMINLKEYGPYLFDNDGIA